MAFPSQHVYPAGLPSWLRAGHALAAEERVAVTPYEQGEDRQREINSFSSFLVSVSTVLRQAQFDRFLDWYEINLRAGVELFDTEVGGLNGKLTQWWQAQFVGPYRLEGLGVGVYRVTAELFLLDGPYDADNLPEGSSPGDPPRVAPSVNSRGLVQTDGRATFDAAVLQARGLVETDGWFIFDTSINARGLVETDGWAIAGEPDEEEDADMRLVEPGDDRLIESGEARLTE
jgi:hypothetical protein